MRLTVLIFLVLLFAQPSPVRGQETVEQLFPSGDALGEGWQQIAFRGRLQGLDPSFVDFGRAVYVGPTGERLVLIIYRTGAGAASIRNSWEIVNDVFDRTRVSFNYDFSRDRDLEERPNPIGCVDARRSEGTEQLIGDEFTVGMTLCAADPDLLILAISSGKINGVHGVAASDRVVDLVFSSLEATPTP